MIRLSLIFAGTLAIFMGTAPTHARVDLGDFGLSLGGSYEGGFQLPPIGSDAGSSEKQRLTLNMKLDTEKATGLKGGTLFFQYQNHNGVHGVTNIGDFQQFDGLDDPEYDRIHMFWYEQKFLNDRLRVKVGKVEPKSEFFAPENARNHLGFSTERSPTIIAQGPPSMSINAFASLTENVELAVGVYDATWGSGRDENTFNLYNFFKAADYAIFTEARVKWQGGLNGLSGGMKLGYWKYDGPILGITNQLAPSTDGLYVTLDQTLTKNGLGVYGQFGTADDAISAVGRHYGAGLQWLGAFKGRQRDIFGVGYSRVTFSDEPGAPFTASHETAYEVFYKAFFGDHFIVQADLQFIDNPGGRGADDVLVPTIRLTGAF